jgi:CheY-like chemotaxis protein
VVVSERATKQRILVVDDHPDSVDIMCTFLRLLGHEAHGATTGAGALSAAATLEPTLVLLDIGLPDISGYEVARRLREDPRRRPYLTALTGLGQARDRLQAFAAGFDQHVTKPADGAVLQAIIAALEACEARRTSKI